MRRFIAALFAFALCSVPAMATPPVFNGNVITNSLPTFNVKAYGAKVDGSTNDSTAVNAAEGACNSAGGGRVYFPAGTTIAAGITYYTGCYQVGDGVGASIVKAPNGANTAVFISNSFASLTGTNGSGGVYHSGFSDLTVDGNKANQTAGAACIQNYGYIEAFQNLSVQNCYGDGLYSEWGNAGMSGQDNGLMETWGANIRSTNNGGNGITWRGPHDSVLTNVITALNSAYGMYFGGNGFGILVHGCHSWGGAQTWAIYIDNSMSAEWLTNCVAEGASVGQLYFGGNNNAFMGQIYGIPIGAVGAQFGSVGHGASANTLIATIQEPTSQTSAALAFTDDFGLNNVQGNVYCASGTTPMYSGSVSGSDTVVFANNTCGTVLANQVGYNSGSLLTGTLSATSGNITTVNSTTVNASGSVSTPSVGASSNSNLNLSSNKPSSGLIVGNYNAGSNNNQGFEIFDGGTTNAIHLLPTSTTNGIVTISFASGAPTGSCVAGSLYARTDSNATAGAELYVCRNVSGTGTWEAVSGG